MPNILIVDDETQVAKSLNRLLEPEGYSVFHAENVSLALELLKDIPNIAVVLLDQRMKGMNGGELSNEISNLYPQVQKILLTGYTELESIRATINRGGLFKLLLKPWDDQELLESIEQGYHAYTKYIESENTKEQLLKLTNHLEKTVEKRTKLLKLNVITLERFERVVEQLPVGVLCTLPEGNIVFLNSRFCDDHNVKAHIEGRLVSDTIANFPLELISNFQPVSGQKMTFLGSDCIVSSTEMIGTDNLKSYIFTVQKL